jgi:hypothetical protein
MKYRLKGKTGYHIAGKQVPVSLREVVSIAEMRFPVHLSI